ncbi:MAG TPA: hypothetical protein VGE98_05585 [Thermoanaerobaculia bacterium]
MVRSLARVCLALAAFALLAGPATAEIFYVKLTNGATIETRYQPQQSSWDAGTILVLSDVGNWIGLAQKDIDSVTSDTEVSGFGVAINTTTVAIGWAPNDNIDPNAPEADQQAKSGGNAAQQQTAQALQGLLQQREAQSKYTIQQGVQTEQTQGIPAGLINPVSTVLTPTRPPQ